MTPDPDGQQPQPADGAQDASGSSSASGLLPKARSCWLEEKHITCGDASCHCATANGDTARLHAAYRLCWRDDWGLRSVHRQHVKAADVPAIRAALAEQRASDEAFCTLLRSLGAPVDGPGGLAKAIEAQLGPDGRALLDSIRQMASMGQRPARKRPDRQPRARGSLRGWFR